MKPLLLMLLTSLAPATAADFGEALNFQVVHPPLGALPNDPVHFAIRSSEEWLKWRQAGATFQPLSTRPQSPEIDFEHFTLIVASSGQKGAGGNAVGFIAVFELSGSMNVWVQESVFLGTCAVYPPFSNHIAAALIPKSEKPIVFHISKAQSECDSLKTSTDRVLAK